MFWIFFIATWTIMNAYVFWRVAGIPAVRRRVGPSVLAAGFFILWALLPAKHAVGKILPFFLLRPLAMAGENWLGVLFLLFCCLLVMDVATGFGLLFRRRASMLRALAMACGCVLSLIGFYQGLRAPVIHYMDVPIAHLPASANNTRLVLISDLHLGAQLRPDWLAARVAQIQGLKPDILIVAGDLLDGHDAGLDPAFLPVLRTLGARFGVWAVLGNHEIYIGADDAARFMAQANIRVLRDTWAQVMPGLVLAGVEDSWARHGLDGSPGRIIKALAGRPGHDAAIVVCHRPENTTQAARAGADLMLCGHTHGGQIWPFNIIASQVNPLLAGLYHVSGMPVAVCRGTGTWGPRMRLWRPSEIICITLRGTGGASRT